jgi:dihydroneopterin aldolase
MSDSIRIEGITAKGFHGVFPEEKRDGQLFIVDAVLSLDLTKAANSDDLAETVDYSAVAREIENEIKSGSYDLIEMLAGRIASGILEKYSLVHRVEVTVHKPEANLGVTFSDLSVTITRTR